MTEPLPDVTPGPRTGAVVDSVADMRSTARWTIGALGAVGGLVLGGLPLAGVSEVHGSTGLWLAFSGLALTVLGVSWAVYWTGDVLTPRLTTPAAWNSPAVRPLRAVAEAEPSLFFGPFGRSPADLVRACELHATVLANLTSALAAQPAAAEADELRAARAIAEANLAGARRRLTDLLDLMHAWSVRAALVTARWHTLAGGIAVAGGVTLFLRAL
ncbi:hypothetical protein ACFRAR_08155 [Kitasatospora sp. NPDC056651]|uniref:hypothetical protein n=1 Tax=Kitasatospora sp. NPDC056651 TaxID=3345892 RepID=UPI0036ABADD5